VYCQNWFLSMSWRGLREYASLVSVRRYGRCLVREAVDKIFREIEKGENMKGRKIFKTLKFMKKR